jgi:hypothetical protein
MFRLKYKKPSSDEMYLSLNNLNNYHVLTVVFGRSKPEDADRPERVRVQMSYTVV